MVMQPQTIREAMKGTVVDPHEIHRLLHWNIRRRTPTQVSEFYPELPALKIGVDGEHAIDNQMTAGECIGRVAIEAYIRVATVRAHAAL